MVTAKSVLLIALRDGRNSKRVDIVFDKTDLSKMLKDLIEKKDISYIISQLRKLSGSGKLSQSGCQ